MRDGWSRFLLHFQEFEDMWELIGAAVPFFFNSYRYCQLDKWNSPAQMNLSGFDCRFDTMNSQETVQHFCN